MSIDDDIGSRLVGQQSVVVTWIQDYACRVCRAFGGVMIHATSSRLGDDGIPMPQETTEEILEMIFRAHRTASSLCRNPLPRLELGMVWRWEPLPNGRRRMIILDKKRAPGEPAITSYRWPPWEK